MDNFPVTYVCFNERGSASRHYNSEYEHSIDPIGARNLEKSFCYSTIDIKTTFDEFFWENDEFEWNEDAPLLVFFLRFCDFPNFLKL